MANIEQYLSALRRAQQANDTEAVQYFESKIREIQNQAQPDAQGVISGMAEDSIFPESVVAGFAATGRGFEDVYRGAKRLIGMDLDPRDEKSWQALEQEYPTASTVGQITGQAAPFLLAGPAAAIGRSLGYKAVGAGAAPALSNVARVAGGAGLGAAEGAAITAGAKDDASALEILGGAGVGGVFGGAAETIMPMLGSLYRKLRAKPLVDSAGNFTKEAEEVINQAGLNTPEDKAKIQEYLSRIKVAPGEQLLGRDLERALQFEAEGIPYTRGDVLGTDTAEGFEQKVLESRLLENSTDELAQPVRDIRRSQSGIIQEKLSGMSSDPSLAGDLTKQALSKRDQVLRGLTRRYYRDMAKRAESVGDIPIDTDSMVDFDLLDDIEINESAAIPALKKRLLQYGIGSEQDLARAAENGVEFKPLTLANSERFRKMLNAAMQDNPRMQAAVSPILRNLDDQVQMAAEALGDEGGELLGSLTKARGASRAQKREFDPRGVVGRLIKAKGSSGAQVVEASDVFRTIMPTNARPKTEDLGRVVKSLQSSGKRGERALDALQGAAVARFMDKAFSQGSNRVGDQVLFSANNFNKAIEQFGEDNLKILFAGNKARMNELMKIKNIAENLRIDTKTVPKGSASFIGDMLNKVSTGLISTKLGAPVGALIEGAQALTKKAELRKQAKSIGKTGPKLTPIETEKLKRLNEVMPNAVTAMGLAPLLNELQEDEQQ